MSTEIYNPSGYEMPKPTRLLILDDMSRGDSASEARIRELSHLIDSSTLPLYVNQQTLADRLKQKYATLVARNQIQPLDLVIALGKAGEDVATLLELSTPVIRINPTRRVQEDGLPEIISKTGIPFDKEIQQTMIERSLTPESFRSIGIVDDTIFFGGTMNTAATTIKEIFPTAILTAMTLTYASPFARKNLANIPVIAALRLRTAEQNTLGINSIDAKDFIYDDALPLQNGQSIPFMEEENWMRAWFGENYEAAYAICEELKQKNTL